MRTVVVRKGRAKPLWKGHPWVFRDSVQSVDGGIEAGDAVRVADPDGRPIGCGFISPGSQIMVRLLTRGPDLGDEEALFRERIARAVALRRETLQLPVVTDGYRLVHAEGDRLPGLIVDRFAGYLVVQLSTVGMFRRREAILDALEEIAAPRGIYEQPDRRVARLEGLPADGGLRRGAAPVAPPSILENGVCFRIPLGAGQKTGFFADQRDNRALFSRYARDRSVLDVHTYSGGFALYAAANGAPDVVGIDSSGPALALAVENALLNRVRQVRFERADARSALNELHRQGRRFDIVVCDPPKFARDRAGLPRALRAYRDLHLRALRVVAEGGLIALSSCSGLVDEAAFETTLRDAAYDLGLAVQVIHRGGQAPDHPVLASCPESRYLKFIMAAVTRT